MEVIRSLPPGLSFNQSQNESVQGGIQSSNLTSSDFALSNSTSQSFYSSFMGKLESLEYNHIQDRVLDIAL